MCLVVSYSTTVPPLPIAVDNNMCTDLDLDNPFLGFVKKFICSAFIIYFPWLSQFQSHCLLANNYIFKNYKRVYFRFISIHILKSNISANNLFARGQVDPVLAVGRVRGSCVGGGGEAHDVIVTSELLRIQYLPMRALQVGLHC